ncbi:PKD-like domain-containing protein [Chryseolinea sp. T2]|uniref:PKD-like domain-containing protein n=1 Tax=Chryseolinea sp. T2 TaxID=3129255 RepID=UPI00307763F7
MADFYKVVLRLALIMLLVAAGYAVRSQCAITDLQPAYCIDDAPVTFTAGSNVYGPGIAGTTFSPAVAGPGTHNIYSSAYTMSNVGTFSPDPTTGTSVSFGAGENSAPTPIGFSFSFFGQAYSSLVVNANGYVTFGTYPGSGVSQSLPSTTGPNNLIAGAWDDLDVTGGDINTALVGVAPNRRFLITYDNVGYASAGPEKVTFQIQLHETSNVIEIHTTSVQDDGGAGMTQGIENPSGEGAYANYNNTSWTATGEYLSFTPTCAIVQTVTVSPSNSLNVVAPATICPGSGAPVTIQGSQSGIFYQLQNASTSAALSSFYAGTGGNLTILSNNLFSNTTIKVYARNSSNGCDVDLTMTVTVNPSLEPVTIDNQPVDATVCQGVSTSFTVDAGATTTPIYKWEISTDGGVSFSNVFNVAPYSGANTATLNIANTPLSLNGNFYRVRVSGACGLPEFSDAVALTVNQNVSIGTGPAAAVVCSGGGTQFTVAATGTALTYQWQVSTNGGGSYSNVSNGGVYSGALTSTLNLTGVTSAYNTYLYRVVVGGVCAAPVTSAGASLTVNDPVSVTMQPVSATMCENGIVQFTVAATGAGLTYQWYEGPLTALSDGGVYSGTATNQLTLSNVPSSFNGRTYYVRLAGTCTPAFNSNVATLAVNELPEVISDPVDQAVCSGGSASFSASAGVTTGATYQWEVSTDGGGTYGSVVDGGVYAGALTNTLSLTGVSNTYDSYKYRLVVGGSCPSPVNSNAATLTVNDPIAISVQPVSATVCEDGTIQFDVTATGTGLTYQWYEGPLTALSDGGVYGGTTTSQLTLTNVPSTFNGRTYYVRINGSCSPVSSSAATLTVNEKPEVTGHPSSQVICAGGNTTFTVNAGVTTGPTYQWQVSTNGGSTYSNVSNGGVYSGALTSTLTLTGAPYTYNTYQYRAVVNGTCVAPVNSNAAILTVNDPIAISVQPVSATVCEDGTIQFDVTATGTGLTYQWFEGPLTALSDGGVYGGTTTSQLILTNVPSTFNGRTYYVRINGGCLSSVNSSAATLTVNEKPEVTGHPSSQVICAGGNTTFTVNAGVTTGPTYQWQVSTNGGSTYSNVSNGGVYSGALTSTLTLTGAPFTYNTYQYRAVVNGTCVAPVNSNAATLTVNDPIAISVQPVSATVCEDGTIQFDVTATGTGLTYQWYEGPLTALSDGGVYGGTTTSQLTLTNVPSTFNGRTYYVRINGSCSPVSSSAATLTVNEKPEVTGHPSSQVICAGGNTTFTVNAGVTTGATYQWQLSTDGGTTFNNISNGGVYSGVLTSTLNLAGAPYTYNTYQYRAVVNGTCVAPVNSNAATLTVNDPIAISVQPVSATVCEDGTIQFDVTATGTGLTYQWYEGPLTALSDGGVYGGTTTSQLTLTNVPSTFNGRTYYVRINGGCLSSVNSSAATLTINEKPEVTGHPSSQVICAGGNTTFTVNAGVTTGPTYQWQVSTNGGSTYSNVSNGGVYSGALTSTLTLTGAPYTYNTYRYRAVVNGMCVAPVNSNAAILTVNDPIAISVQPVSATVCEDGTVQFSVTATGTGMTYQWFEGPLTSLSDGGVYSGTATNQLTLTNVPSIFNGRTYYVRINGSCSPVSSSAATLTVNEKPEVTGHPSSQVICAGGNTTFTVNAGVTTGATYQWQLSTDGGTTFNNISNGGVYSGALTSTLTLTGAPYTYNTYRYRAVVNGTCVAPVNSNAAILTVNDPIAISVQPVSATVCEDGTIQFDVTATGTGLTYQWYEGPLTALSDGGVYGGTTTSQLTLTNVPSAFNGRTYYVRINGGCLSSVNSSAATLTVNEKPEVTGHPSSQVICAGGNTTFTVNAGVTTGPTYQWQVSLDGGTTFNNISNGGVYSGVLTSTLTLTAAPSSYDTYQYRAVVNGTCVAAVNSNAATLTVNTLIAVTTQPLSTATCENGPAQFSVVANGTGITYQWQVSVNGGVSYTALSDGGVYAGVTTSLLDLSAIPLSYNNYLYRVVMSGACAPVVISNASTLSVYQNPVVNTAPVAQSICEGSAANFSVAAVGQGLTYQWQENGVDISNGGVYSGATTASLTLSNVPVTLNSRLYRVKITGTCGIVTTTAVALTVRRVPDAFAADASICSGQTTNVAITNPNGVSTTTFTWTIQSVNNVSGAGPGSGSTIAQNLSSSDGVNNGSVTYLIQPVAAGCSGTPYAVTVLVTPLPTASANPQTICSGSTTNVVITNPNSIPGTTYSWTVLTSGNVTGATAGSGSVIAQSLTSTNGTTSGTVTYRITPATGTCQGNTFDVVVTVSPTPVITNSPSTLIQEICSSTALNFTPTASISGTTFTWTSTVVGTLTGVSASGTGAVNDTPQNATNTSAVIIYTITPHVAGCAGTPVSYVVTVRPVTQATASPQTICSGSTTSVAITNPNSVVGTTYTWTAVASNVTGASAGGGNTIAQTLSSADGVSNGTVTYTITPLANGCAGPSFPVVVTVKPVPVLTNASATLSQTTCSGEALNFVPTASIATSTFSWTTTVVGPINPASISSSGSGNITHSPQNTGNVMATVTYHITPAFNGCSGATVDYVVNVKPLPSVTASPITICSGQTAVINLLSTPKSIAGTTYSWTVSASPNVVGASAGDGSTISQQLTSTNSSIGTVTYTVTPMANGCYGPPINVVATVNPIASVNAGADYAVCQPSTISLSGAISGSASAGTWTIISGSGTLSASATSAGNVTATYTVNPSDVGNSVVFKLSTNDPDGAGPCSVMTDDLVVNVNRAATVTLPGDYVVCEPALINLSGTLGGSATSGLWSLVTGTGTLAATSVTGLTATSTYQPSAADVSTVLRFRLTSNDPDGSGPCSSAFDEINITINRAARIDAGPDFAVCEDQSISLAAVASGATSTVIWSGGSGAAQFSPVNNVNSVYTLTPADITAGGVTLKITTNDPDVAGPCTSTADQVFVKINKLPAVFLAGLEGVYAENSGIDNLDGFPAGGSFTGPGIVAGTNQFNPANAGFGTITIRYTYTDPGTTCTNYTERTTIVNPVTDVDFFILEDNRPNPSGNPQICANQGDLTLVGIPPASEGLEPTKFRALSPELVPRIAYDGTQWKLNTNGLLAGTYQMQYIFTNEYHATDTLTKDLIVFSAPQALITVGNNCIEDVLTFTQSSTIPNNLSGGTIINWNWLYDEGSNGSTGTTAEPQYQYIEPGPKNISLEVVTNQACRNKMSKTIVVGQPPTPDFTWSSYCKGDATKFVDQSTSAFGVVNSYAWTFGDGANSATKNPAHTYGSYGYYPVKLSIVTDAGCSADTTKQVYIQELRVLTDDDPYYTNFESGAGTWVAVTNPGDVKNSWVFGTPNGELINSAKSGSNAFWTGSNSGSYFNNENSFVIGPCLNLTALKRPMISLNYWVDAQTNFDGAVVQYSTNGGTTWQTIGDAEGGGINWYNKRNLPGEPGGQSNFAWSDQTDPDNNHTTTWTNGRYNLDQIPVATRDTVILRIAFGSNDDNLSDRTLNGFAFDDIFVGEKTRNVLVEHFANTNSLASNQATEYLKARYADQFSTKDSADFMFMEYHIPFGSSKDQINADNPNDPVARALFYNASQPPNSIMDGIQTDYFNGFAASINNLEIDRRALEDPRFAISIDTLTASGATNTTVRANVTFTYVDTLNVLDNRVTMNVALVERGVGANGPVVRKLLLGGDGKTLERSWAAGDQEPVAIDYLIDVPVVHPDSLYLVAFIQNNLVASASAKTIMQSRVIKLRSKQGQNITGVEDNPVNAELHDLSLYPNPASHVLNITVPGTLGKQYVWHMIDQRGVTVLSGNLQQDFTSGPQEIDISGLANGIYFMSIQTGSQSVVYRKIAVMNKN